MQTSRIRKLCEVPGAVLAAPRPPSAAHHSTLHDEEPVFEPGAWLDAWVTRRLDGGDFAFLRTAPQWLAACLLVWAALGSADELIYAFAPVQRRTELAATVLLYLITIGLVIVAAAAVNLALLHVGLASPTTPMAPGEQVPATLAVYAWHLADALPGPDIPVTLHWTLRHTFTDRWSTILILLSQLAMLGLLIVGVGEAVRSFAYHARPRPATAGALDAAAAFAELFAAARSAADRATFSRVSVTDVSRIRDPHLEATRAAEPEAIWTAEREATQTSKLVAAQLDGVATLFGPGEVTQHADAAVGALHRRSHDLFLARHPSAKWQKAQRENEEQSFRAYLQAAGQALKAAHDRVLSAALDRLDSH